MIREREFVTHTNPIKSMVVTRTTAQIVKAILMFFIIVTAMNTLTNAKRRFSMATERMSAY